MIAISSHRPHGEDRGYADRQIAASRSWAPLFSAIHYFGEYESELEVWNSNFIGANWPTIKRMASYAASQDDYVAIVNADIVLTDGLKTVEEKIKAMTLPAATSYRYEFIGEDLASAVRHKEDRGMDIFIARPEVWKMVAERIPEYLRIGNNRWDSWVCGFFCYNLGYGFRHFTEYRCVFHPKHDGRRQSQFAEVIANGVDEYFTRAKRPSEL